MTKSNYVGLEKMYQEYKDKGLEIFAFPCNQFGDQEPKTELEINDFVKSTYGASFHFFQKTEVNGQNTHPIFKILKNETAELKDKEGAFKNLEWNFAKFLVNPQGKVLKFYDPLVKMNAITTDIAMYI